MPRGYALTIDGNPYIACTNPDAISPSSWLPADDAPTGATILPGALRFGGWSWTEKMRVVEGDLDVSGITFVLEDVVAGTGTGIASGQHWLTYLATRDPRSLGSNVLASSCTASGNFTLATPIHSDLSGAMPGVLWLDAEAILCSAIDAGTGAVTVTTRGYYGTRATAHTRDDELGTRPECWAAPPWTTRRRVILWYINDSGVATALWRGYCQRAPRLSADGAAFELQCESAWSSERARRMGNPSASCRLRGFNRAGVILGLNLPDRDFLATLRRSWRPGDGYDTVYNTFADLVSAARQTLHTRVLATTPPAAPSSFYVATEYDGGTLTLKATANGYTEPVQAEIQVLGKRYTSAPVNSSDPKKVQIEADVPACAVVLEATQDGSTSALAMHIPVDSVSGLPSTFADLTTYTTGVHRTTLQPAMVGAYDERKRFVVYGGSGSGVRLEAQSNDSTIGGPSLTGIARYFTLDTGREEKPLTAVSGLDYDFGIVGSRSLVLVDRPLQLTYTLIVRTTHWLYGLQYALTDTAAGMGVDARQFDFTDTDGVLRYTEGDASAREWHFDGSKTLGDVLTPALIVNGCCPAVRAYGRVGIVAHRYPLKHETPSVSFTSDASGSDLIPGTRVEWTVLPEGLTNEVEVKSGEQLELLVRDSKSVGRFDQGKRVSLELEGLPPTDPAAHDARGIMGRVLTRIIQLWGDPVAQVRWTTTLEHFFDAYTGDFVSITDQTAPDGAGGRGLSSAPVYLTGRTIDLAKGTIIWEGLLLPYAYGYAPAVRVASISSAVLTIAGSYVGGSTDYSGAGGTDRGISDFTAGDRVKLVVRDSTTYTYYDGIILSVNAAASEITLTAAPGGGWPAAASGGIVDLVANDWGVAGLQDAQKNYAYGGGGNAAEGSIASTSEKSRRWAP